MSWDGQLRAGLLTLGFFLLVSDAAASIRAEVNYSPVANLVYQLDCVSLKPHYCSEATFRELWEKEFLKTPSDREALAEWGALLERYNKRVTLNPSDKSEGISLGEKLRVASFQATSPEDYLTRLDLLTLPADRRKFEKAFRHFHPRFQAWWKKTALARGNSFRQSMIQLLARPDVVRRLNQFRHFYEADLPNGYTVPFNLFYRPDSKESTSGQQLGSYSIIEFQPSETPQERVDVVLHELCHFFYWSVKPDQAAAFRKRFADSPHPSARGAFNILNESLATALGNGLVAKQMLSELRWKKYVSTDLSFYQDYYHDKAAKTLYPWLEEWLQAKRTLYDPEFVDRYISMLAQAFGDELTSPKLVLKEVVAVADEKLDMKFRGSVLRSVFGSSSIYGNEGLLSDDEQFESYRAQPHLSAVFIIHNDNLHWLKKREILNESDFDALKKAVKDRGHAVYSYSRAANVPGYVVVTSSASEARRLLESLAAMKRGFTGLAEAR